MMIFKLLLTLALLPFPGGDGPAWGSFRGHNGSGVTNTSHIPDRFDLESNLLWKVDARPGYSSPIVNTDKIYLTAAAGKELSTHCLNLHTGEEIWRRTIEFDGSVVGANSAASPTPLTDGKRIFTLFHHVGMVCYGLDGKLLWRNDLGAPFNLPHGLATSPIVHEGTVIVQLDQDTNSSLVALDAKTGELRWKTERPASTHSYATPVIYRPEEGPVQIIVSGSNQIAAYSATDGKRIWWVDGAAWQSKSLPVIYGDLCIVNSFMVSSSEFGGPRVTETWEEILAARDSNKSGFIEREEWPDEAMMQAWFIFDLDGDDKLNETDFDYLKNAGSALGGLFAIRLDGKGNVTDSHIAWSYKQRRGLSDVTSPVVYDDVLYMLKEGGILTALSASSGELGKQERVGEGDGYFASPVAAGGKLLTTSLGGQLSVIKAGPEWELLSSLQLEGKFWSTPALAEDLILIRSQTALYCFFSE